MPNKSILIVDDDPAIRNALSIVFEQAGYHVAVANSGETALAQLEPATDLVVLDIRLPDIDGYEVCAKIREFPSHPLIVMLTVRDESRDKIRGLESGADIYLTKPFEPRELLAQIQALFRLVNEQHPGAEDSPMTCGALKFWESRHQVTLGQSEVQLTPIEFQLLRCFMHRPGQVFGRETLLREVWGYSFEGDSRTVDVHIQRLRAKLDAAPGQPPLLQTVRGFGYRLVDPGA